MTTVFCSKWWSVLVVVSVLTLLVLYFVLVLCIAESLPEGFGAAATRLAVAFGIVPAALFVALLVLLVFSKQVRESRARLSAIRREQAAEVIGEYAALTLPEDPVLAVAAAAPSEFVQVLAGALSAVRGSLLHRLCKLAGNPAVLRIIAAELDSGTPRRMGAALRVLGTIEASGTREALIRAAAHPAAAVRSLARGLLFRSASPVEQRRVLRTLPEMPHWDRLVLYHQAAACWSDSLPGYLDETWVSDDAETIVRSLELVICVRRFFSCNSAAGLAAHPSVEVRIKFYRAVEWLVAEPELTPAVRLGLSDEDWRVRAMAAKAAAKLRLVSLTPELLHLCGARASRAEAGHAAWALSRFGGDALEELKRLSLDGRMPAHQLSEMLIRSLGAV